MELAYESMHRHVALMLELQARGAITFDYGNNLAPVRRNISERRARLQELRNSIVLPSRVLCPPISVPCFAREKDPSAGRL